MSEELQNKVNTLTKHLEKSVENQLDTDKAVLRNVEEIDSLREQLNAIGEYVIMNIKVSLMNRKQLRHTVQQLKDGLSPEEITLEKDFDLPEVVDAVAGLKNFVHHVETLRGNQDAQRTGNSEIRPEKT